jgi:glutathione S-transferase
MIRYTLTLARDRTPISSDFDIEFREIDINNGEQLSEEYLCTINPKGQVPVLVSPSHLDEPIADSLYITYWLCAKFLSLRPEKHNEEIDRLLEALHAINFFTLSMRNNPAVAASLEGAVEKRLEQDNLSERHRKALEYKLTVYVIFVARPHMPLTCVQYPHGKGWRCQA